MSDPVFPGVHALLALVRTLYRRPRYFERDDDLKVRGDLPLPLVCLLRKRGTHDFLPRLGKALDTELQEVPHVLVDAANVHKQDTVLPLLHELHDQLRKRGFGKQGSIKRFDNYELAHHLTGVELPPREGRRDEPIKRVLHAWSRGDRPSLSPDDVPTDRLRTVVALFKLTGYLIGLYWGRDRVPGLFRERRWFMRQPYMVPRHSPGFLRFAARLTKDQREEENPDQVRKLLVHALLEDLRIAYRRNRLRFLPRRRGWRRTAYVTVLLDNVDANGGWELLRLINEVRNETGRLDPLLVIASGDRAPSWLPSEPRKPTEPTVAEESLAAWKDRLPRRRQLLAADARYLFVALPASVPAADLSERDADAWQTAADDGPRPAPRLARRGIGELIVAAVLVAALTPPALTAMNHWGVGCAFFGAATDGIATEVVRIDGHDQCVGYSDNDGQVFGRNERLRFAQRAVFAQNEVAEQLHDRLPDRPLVSLVYFAGLTSNRSAPAAEHSVAEELEGLVIRQRELNDPTSTVEPLLRVVVANGGTGMAAAPEVVREALVPLAESDRGILGVVGLDRSVAETETAIRELGRHGIPVLGTTLTSVGLGELSPLYFQLVPDNTMQAELVSRYAQQMNATKVTIYHPPVNGSNSYVDTLVEVMRKRLADNGIEVVPEPWEHSPTELDALCVGSADRSSEIAFYAGRELGFGDFLRTTHRNCSDPDKLPHIVADDAVSRFVAHAPGRRQSELNGIRVSYVAMGGLVVLAGAECVAGSPEALPGSGRALAAFCAGYRELREDQAELSQEERPTAPWPGERVGGLYDAAGMFVEAVRRVRKQTGGGAPHRAAVAQEFREMTFQGATGEISFQESRIGNTRNLAILTIEDVYEVTGEDGIPTCDLMIGRLYQGNRTQRPHGCPITG
ncbi:ABC transporter substrate-binding protein [Actinophytocola gossypii]|uniref:Receptor ligand binding region domain-containing protein n=1 Tax=Actinophytocola gossypii TaxID=2812003 RepID=A0ABT2J3T3_9PSEU|nr:hypothetical protein [Actinophytocola gossypii]MCT2582523.1 hypothetical protein [Actinophytocola gossypii]